MVLEQIKENVYELEVWVATKGVCPMTHGVQEDVYPNPPTPDVTKHTIVWSSTLYKLSLSLEPTTHPREIVPDAVLSIRTYDFTTAPLASNKRLFAKRGRLLWHDAELLKVPKKLSFRRAATNRWVVPQQRMSLYELVMAGIV